jgi:hypothetical protein
MSGPSFIIEFGHSQPKSEHQTQPGGMLSLQLKHDLVQGIHLLSAQISDDEYQAQQQRKAD